MWTFANLTAAEQNLDAMLAVADYCLGTHQLDSCQSNVDTLLRNRLCLDTGRLSSIKAKSKCPVSNG